MDNVLVLCPTARDRRELSLVGAETAFFYHDYGTTALEDMLIPHRPAAAVADPLDEHAALVARFGEAGLTAVVSTDDYPGSTLAAMVAASLGLPGPRPAVNLLCQHKFESRRAQRAHVPEATADFAPVDTTGAFVPPAGMQLPAFVKPIKSFFSIGAQRLDDWAALEPLRERWSTLHDFFAPFERLLAAYTDFAVGGRRLILESLLHGVQVTVEGYRFRGATNIFGVVDSVMFPGTIVFQRFEYPSSLPAAVQERMCDIARRVMEGVGFDDGMFNIEMMYDAASGAIHIIEINPRMASQFADLYEKVDGTSTYRVMLDIARGRDPAMARRRGPYAFAASCVLRTFSDQEILAHPSQDEIAELSRTFPGLRVEAVGAVGGRLSDTMQDEMSFRYGLVHLGGRDREDVLAALAECERRLTFRLRPL